MESMYVRKRRVCRMIKTFDGVIVGYITRLQAVEIIPIRPVIRMRKITHFNAAGVSCGVITERM